jgi:ubiquinone/menaquinone biosynthesis C-methylase UbiE
MNSHWDHIASYFGDLKDQRLLDLGSGRGPFLIDATKRGAQAVGLEYNPEYIRITRERAAKEDITVDVRQGEAEHMPFPDASFDFVNINEVIEHVRDPHAMLAEVRRVLKPGGGAYISVPARYGLHDPHYNLYFVNWLPRAWADGFIKLFGRQKDYADHSAGMQRLADMHYYTYSGILQEIARAGLVARDIRAWRIQHEMRGGKRLVVTGMYFFIRPFWFDSFHILLTKPAL